MKTLTLSSTKVSRFLTTMWSNFMWSGNPTPAECHDWSRVPCQVLRALSLSLYCYCLFLFLVFHSRFLGMSLQYLEEWIINGKVDFTWEERDLEHNQWVFKSYIWICWREFFAHKIAKGWLASHVCPHPDTWCWTPPWRWVGVKNMRTGFSSGNQLPNACLQHRLK